MSHTGGTLQGTPASLPGRTIQPYPIFLLDNGLVMCYDSTMKTCPFCALEVPPSRPITAVYCSTLCATSADKKRRRSNRPKSVSIKAKEKRAKQRRIDRNKDYVYLDKSNGCSRCPERRPSCLDYHHIDPSTKSGDVSRFARLGLSFQKLVDEIGKCIILCANCHRVEELGTGFRTNTIPLES